MKLTTRTAQPFVIVLALVLALALGCKKQENKLETALDAAPGAPAAATSAEPATEKGPFLWRIQGAQAPSYLFGTIHVPDERVTTLAAPVDRALGEADVVLTEIPMDAKTQLSVAPKLMLPEGQTLKLLLPGPLYGRVDAKFRAKGLPFEQLGTMKVWAITTQLVLLDYILEMATKEPLDAIIYGRGQAAGKQVDAIETVDEQLSVFDSLTTQEQIHMLASTMDMLDEHKKEGRDAVGELVAAYASGEDAKLQKAMLDAYDANDPLDKKLTQRLFTDRNATMATRIADKVRAAPEKKHFFAIGAGHLVGSDSVVAQLRQKGFEVRRER